MTQKCKFQFLVNDSQSIEQVPPALESPTVVPKNVFDFFPANTREQGLEN